MEWGIQWFFLVLSVFTFFYWILRPPFKEWLLVFFFGAFLSLPLGTLLVALGYFTFPIRFFPDYFVSSVLFEYLVLPLITVRYYQSSYGSKFFQLGWKALLYSLGITGLEFVLERYTDLIEYHNWSFAHTLLSTFLYLLIIHYFILAFEKLPMKRRIKSSDVANNVPNFTIKEVFHMDFLRHLIRFAVSALVLLIVGWLVPGFTIAGYWSAFMAALVIALIGWAIEAFMGPRISPYSRGFVGFIVSALVIYVTQFVISGFHVSLIGALLAALVIGIVDGFIPAKPRLATSDQIHKH